MDNDPNKQKIDILLDKLVIGFVNLETEIVDK